MTPTSPGDGPGGPSAATDRALEVAQEAEAVETPLAADCARVAAAWEQAGAPVEAARWAVRAVDGGGDFTAWRRAARVLDRVLPDHAPEEVRTTRIGVLGTSTITPLVPMLRLALAREGFGATIYEAPYGQYWQEALDPSSGLRSFGPEVVVLVPDHHALGDDQAVVDPELWVAEHLDRLIQPWSALATWEGVDVVQASIAEPAVDPLGSLAAGQPGSRRARLRELNRRLAVAAREARVGLVDVEAIAARLGKDAWFDPRYWHAARQAAAFPAWPELARSIVATVVARAGRTRKCLVLDLDNTIWGGVIGDDGLDGIVLSGTKGEVFGDVQRAIVQLAQRGVVLAVCSKNDPATAREVFERHPDMVLTLDHVAAFEASWDPKPVALRRISTQLGLGLDALVLLDDNPAERDAVRRELPMVDVLALPPDVAAWPQLLLGHPRFEPASFTVEDQRRTEQYQARAAASALEADAGSLAEFQASLAMRAQVSPVDEMNVDRVAQLIAKTNQFNLTNRRHPPERVRSIARDPRWLAFAVRLRDRFADHGLVAVVLAEEVDDALVVDSFVMSCRVIGRALEHVVMGELVAEARRRGLHRLRAHYAPSDRNGLVADLWPRLGMDEEDRTEDGLVTYVLNGLEAAMVTAPIDVERSVA